MRPRRGRPKQNRSRCWKRCQEPSRAALKTALAGLHDHGARKLLPYVARAIGINHNRLLSSMLVHHKTNAAEEMSESGL